MKNLKPILLFCFVLLTQSIYAQLYEVGYKPLSPDPFAGFDKPIGLAILPFTYNGRYSDFTEKLYNEIVKDVSVFDKFTIYPYSVLQEQQSALGITNYKPNDRTVLKKLKDNLDIRVVLTGKLNKADGSEVEVKLINTSNGNTLFTEQLKNSTNSTALKDAVVLITKNKSVYYKNLPVPEGMVYVKGGWFEMGSNNGGSEEKPVHRVYVDDFYISKYEVTFAEYDRFCEATGRSKPDDMGWGRGNRSVIFVSWYDAVEYCNWLSRQTGKHYRLPTEAEWEYAARGGNKSRGYKYSGSDNINRVAWYDGNSNDRTHPVGTKQPNELGIYDMSGNLWEWCSDWYDSDYYSRSPERNPKGPTSGNSRVLRGGSWDFDVSYCRVANRYGYNPGSRDYSFVFCYVQDL